eukprot:UN00992
MGGQNYKSCNDSHKIGCDYLARMTNASETMMLDRAKVSESTNFLISQHYPSEGKKLVDDFKSVRGAKAKNDLIWSAFGHTHAQKCDRTYNGACDAILTGGGGGCCSEHTLRGFYVIGFDADKRMTHPYKYNDPLLSCQYPCGTKFTDQEIIESTFDHCCYEESFGENVNFDCSIFDLSKCK